MKELEEKFRLKRSNREEKIRSKVTLLCEFFINKYLDLVKFILYRSYEGMIFYLDQ